MQPVTIPTGYFPFFLTLFIAAVACLVALALASLIGPKRPSKEKLREYECGIKPLEPPHQRLDIHFYKVGILFLIFGVELVFFFPWALALANGKTHAERVLALVDMLIFAVILISAFIFAWAKGGFEWWKVHGKSDRET